MHNLYFGRVTYQSLFKTYHALRMIIAFPKNIYHKTYQIFYCF